MSVCLLGIDTSNGACSAGLWLDGECLERYEVAPRGHGLLLLPMVESLLAEAGLALAAVDALALGRGPGSFTGLRIATGMGEGLAFAIDRPGVPVSSLATLAQGAVGVDGLPAERVLAAFDARMAEVYWGAYRRSGEGLVALVGDERVVPPGQARAPDDGAWIGVGEGWSAYGDDLMAAVGDRVEVMVEPLYPRARDLLALAVRAWDAGDAVPAEQALPVYLRDQVVALPTR
jgi:tRNA threonylcarbamoyladenosine biosynthesis protein TsaB